MQVTTLTICILLAHLKGIYTAQEAKLAPSMRDKKSVADMAYPDPPAEVVNNNVPADTSPDEDAPDKRAPSGFMGMRGKKPFDSLDVFPEGLYKRAPSGFMGMRGKKMSAEEWGDEYSKRAPSGFMGMRGKKEYLSDKRAPSGFMGMRGKKEFELPLDQYKRTPMSSGFFGMRGKKQPGRSGFFGMRGKKYPYEFRGKFVGVRGKKAENDATSYFSNNMIDENDISQLAEALDLNQLMLLLTDSSSAPWETGRPNELDDHDI